VTLTDRDTAAVQRRILVVLSVTQVLAGVGMATALAVSTLVASRLSGSELIGGAALTCVVLGAAAAALVVARVATRRGRRPALGLGYGVGTAGAAVAAVAVAVGSAAAMLVGLLLVGAATAAGLAARFAATDLAAPERRARALGLVVWSTTVGAVAGPNLAGPVQTLAGSLGAVPAAGPFWLCAVAFGLAAVGTWWGLRPDPLLVARSATAGPKIPESTAADARAALLASPAALLGAGGVVLGHLVMIALMSMTPVHLDHGGATLTVVGLVISAHVAGMYAFSPVFGWLADRLGPPRVLALAAVLLLAAAMVCAVAGPERAGLVGVGLVLLGLGWSASLIAGSALVTESVTLAVRPRAQGLVDVAMNVSGAVGGIAGGLVVAAASFGVLGVAAAVVVVPYLVAAGGFALRGRPAVG
jgi:MFS family permease